MPKTAFGDVQIGFERELLHQEGSAAGEQGPREPSSLEMLKVLHA